MSELVRAAPREIETHFHDDPTGGRLIAWANGLAAAHQIGKALCSTSFVPATFKGKPEEAAAAILFGDEIGLTPTQSLRSIYVISGSPSLYARAMVALVMGHGHEIWVEEDTPTKVTVSGRRRGSERVTSVTWDMDRARKAGYTGNKKYDSDPQAMLYARAAGDVARKVAPDVLLGIPYSVEEMELQDVETSTVTRTASSAAPAKVTRKKAEPAAAAPEMEPSFDTEPPPVKRPAARHEPPEGLDTETVDLPPLPAEPVDPDAITDAQSKKMHASFRDRGMTERELALAFCFDTIGREITTTKELTKAEASKVIDALEQFTEVAEPELPLTDLGKPRADDPRLGKAGADGWGRG